MKIHEQFPARATSRPVKYALTILALLGGACSGNPGSLPDDLIGERARVVSAPAGLTNSPVGGLSLMTADSVVLKTDYGVWQPVRLGPNARLEISRGVTSRAECAVGVD